MKRIICILALLLGLIALMTSCSFFSFSTEGLEYIELEDGSYAVKAGEAIDLEEIVIPNTYNGKPVTQIAAEGFKEASNLKDVTIPKNVTVIGESAFEGCTMLKKVKVADNSALKKIEKSAFNECRTLLYINIPEGVTEIGERAFYYCTSMTNITIPSTVKTVGRETFYFCSSLYKVTHRGDVSISVGNTGNIIVTVDKDGTVNYSSKNWILTDDDFLFRSYDGEYGLIAYVGSKETVTLPRDYNGKPCNIVSGKGMRKVTIPEGLTSIRESAFQECNALETIKLPGSLTSIENNAFVGCISLESVELPIGLKSIGRGAFSGCCLLENISIPSGVEIIEESAFISCERLSRIDVNLFNFNYKSVDGNLYTKDGKTLVLYAIGKEAKSFIVPSEVKEIGGYAFAYTTNLESVVVPNNVSSIGNMAFYHSTIKNIELSEGLTDIGDGAFYSCDNLEKIDLPEGLINIGASAFAFSSKITELIIPDSVVSIGDEAFKCMQITSIVIPDNVTEIGVRMFEGCGCLTEVIIGSGVTSIGTYAFLRCSALESITIPANVKTINKGAFQDCTKLKSVVSEGKYWINVSNSISSDPASMAKYLTGSGVNSKISR